MDAARFQPSAETSSQNTKKSRTKDLSTSVAIDQVALWTPLLQFELLCGDGLVRSSAGSTHPERRLLSSTTPNVTPTIALKSHTSQLHNARDRCAGLNPPLKRNDSCQSTESSRISFESDGTCSGQPTTEY